MKGSTHAMVGATISGATALLLQMDFAHGALCVACGTIAALSPDLDGRGMLAHKLSKPSRAIYQTIFTMAFLSGSWGIIQYVLFSTIAWWAIGIAVGLLIVGGSLNVGIIRNLLFTIIGVGLIALGLYTWKLWLAGLGFYIAWAPWQKHRGFTHTIWCNLGWVLIGWGLERDSGIVGITWAIGLSYLSHLVLDTMTPSGIKWLYPLSGKTFRFK